MPWCYRGAMSMPCLRSGASLAFGLPLLAALACTSSTPPPGKSDAGPGDAGVMDAVSEQPPADARPPSGDAAPEAAVDAAADQSTQDGPAEAALDAPFEAAAVAWTSHLSGTTQNLSGLWGSAANDVWAVGVDGSLEH